MATCPDCEYEDIDTMELEEGDTLSCPECGRKLVMNGLGELDFADPDDDLDDDDEEEDEDEDEDETGLDELEEDEDDEKEDLNQ